MVTQSYEELANLNNKYPVAQLKHLVDDDIQVWHLLAQGRHESVAASAK